MNICTPELASQKYKMVLHLHGTSEGAACEEDIYGEGLVMFSPWMKASYMNSFEALKMC